MVQFFNETAGWVAQHPQAAWLLVFLVAFSESLVLVGLLVPGAVLMFAAGALIGTGHLHFWTTFAWAVAGAVAGDGLSFWLGWHYRSRLREMWPFARHHDWLERGEAFFNRHGNMSIALGRFVGPVRPIIPAVAGMMGMRPGHFVAVNVASAFLWAPAYLLPGMAFGTSLAIAGQVAGRLALLLVGLLLALWLAFWLVRRIYRVVQPRAALLATRLLRWGHRHPLLGRFTDALLDPEVPPPRALFVMALLLLGGGWLIFALLIYAGPPEQLLRIDQNVRQLFTGLRSPWGDHLMVFLSQLGEAPVTATLAMVILGLLAWQKRWREVRYWLAALGFIVADMIFLQQIGSLAGAAPHVPLVPAVILYGFLAAFVSQELHPRWRWLPYAWTALLICAIALARLYLDAIRFSDLLGDTGLGLVWVIILGVAYHRHLGTHRPIPYLPLTILLTLVASSGWQTAFFHQEALRSHAPRVKVETMEAVSWWRQGWRKLPAFRIDLGGEYEQPLNVQWAGDLEMLRNLLLAQGWHPPPPIQATTLLRWLSAETAVQRLPVPPQLHAGRLEALRLVKETAQGRLILRLWHSGVRLAPGNGALWVGTVSAITIRHLGFIRLPVSGGGFTPALEKLARDLEAVARRKVEQRQPPVPHPSWNGAVLLLWAAESAKENPGRELSPRNRPPPRRG
ncbi:MAG TPA: phosphoesterase PA-phosphatase [Gammaproteobacteria bacterium]|nr:phosphoesterase PA-phosphatase [Gammaproteobacteria bacterium]